MKMRQEELELEASLGYIISSRSDWAIQLLTFYHKIGKKRHRN